MEFADELDLSLAWRKAKRDYSHYMNSFTSSPFISECIDHNEDEWLSHIRQQLIDDDFVPRTPRMIDVPKNGYYLRPASILHPEDLVVYSSFILEVYDEIRSSIKWSAGECRFSHILREDPSSSNQWGEFEKQHWTAMQDEKIDQAENAEYVLETDVSGFYENIDVERAVSIFKQMAESQNIGNELRHLLRPWAEPRKRGVPQGYGPSDILAEIYLDGVDRRLVNSGFQHVRYNDDFTVFCESRDEAIEAQNLLERIFRARGLNMKSGKTSIIPSTDALESYAEPESIFEQLKEADVGDENEEIPFENLMGDLQGGSDRSSREAAAEYARSMDSDSVPYGESGGPDQEHPVSDGGQEGNTDPFASSLSDNSQQHLETAYSNYIEGVEFEDLDIHLFRYIINRLGRVESEIAVGYCIDYIQDGHSDVRRVLHNYFSKLSNSDEIGSELATAIVEQDIRYEYHIFVVLRWLYNEDIVSSEVTHAARRSLERSCGSIGIREYAIAILSANGDYSDWEHIESLYREVGSETTQAVIAYALRRFEKGRRAIFYNRIENECELVDLAIDKGRSDSPV